MKIRLVNIATSRQQTSDFMGVLMPAFVNVPSAPLGGSTKDKKHTTTFVARKVPYNRKMV